VGKAHDYELSHYDHRALPLLDICSLLLFCSSYPPRMLVPLRPSRFYGSRSDNHATMNPRNSKVPIELHVGRGALWVGVDWETVGFVSLFFQPSSFAIACWSKECRDHYSIFSYSPFFNPRQSSKVWIELSCSNFFDYYRLPWLMDWSTMEPKSPFACLRPLRVYLLLSWFYSFDFHWSLWRMDQRKVNPFFSSICLFHARACTYFIKDVWVHPCFETSWVGQEWHIES
jgi:hypothetical protein